MLRLYLNAHFVKLKAILTNHRHFWLPKVILTYCLKGQIVVRLLLLFGLAQSIPYASRDK
ncbi:Uncharacterised protein [Shigella sonnei]|nr:Uncharacterised protein [Shigella sonnei]CSJ18255.1 Uncharacterised protein [Shigella sonnei]CSN69887.1 Uncharacterised protein [Shigella sonnei]CSP50130.1 Uncharacterised protein [Shigella sonnei]CSP97145.1 Uncharacterised protein [Shigella sonnei]